VNTIHPQTYKTENQAYYLIIGLVLELGLLLQRGYAIDPPSNLYKSLYHTTKDSVFE
jgi:hypothetical protein